MLREKGSTGMRHKLESQRGTVLMVAMVLILLLASLSLAYMAITGGQLVSTHVRYKGDRALYIAEAGLADSVADLTAGGSGQVQAQFAGGNFVVTAAPVSTNKVLITSEGSFADAQRSVQVVAYSGVHQIFRHAIFAGDSSDDSAYVLRLGGEGDQADEVTGHVYSGERLAVEGSAVVASTLRAEGDITGASGESISLLIPDLEGMDYPNNHDINVNQEFDYYGEWSSLRSSRYGGGWAVPEQNPAHIFHKNPTDRQGECTSTPGDDFFLEDIYEDCHSDNALISIAVAGNDKVYFIQGDLWIHNKHALSLQLKDTQTHITIVVEGSIHICDDFYYCNGSGGVAFIAIEAPIDPNGEYSGNIYIGDSAFGTLEEINAFLYAENNFVDENLDAGGSAEFRIYGTMSAGNHVLTNRDFAGSGHWEGAYPHRYWVPDPGVETYHSRMVVTLDDRIFTGELVLPGLPEQHIGDGHYTIIGWREVRPQ